MFAIRLKQLREEKGLSQAQLARKLGVGQSTVGMWENGKNKPQNAKLEMLAEIFGVGTDYLLGRDTPHPQDDEKRPISSMQFAVLNKTKDFTEDEWVDLDAMANIIIARRDRK